VREWEVEKGRDLLPNHLKIKKIDVKTVIGSPPYIPPPSGYNKYLNYKFLLI